MIPLHCCLSYPRGTTTPFYANSKILLIIMEKNNTENRVCYLFIFIYFFGLVWDGIGLISPFCLSGAYSQYYTGLS